MRAPIIIVASIASLLGMWAYVSKVPYSFAETSAEGDDAVQLALRAGKPTVVEFGSNNCASCLEMKPILEGLAQDQRVAVASVDILKERHYVNRYQIRLMPTQIFFDARGRETGRHMGKIGEQEIRDRLVVADSTNLARPEAQP